MIKAIILLGGIGQRLKEYPPKQYHVLGNKKLYLHTLQPFLAIEHFSEILLVCENRWCEEVACEVADYPTVRVIPGGKTRQESSYLGLRAAGALTQYVVIHDGVRPFVSIDLLRANISAVHLYNAVDTCIPTADTIVYAPKTTHLLAIPNRKEYLRGQTPQSFSYPLILKAHQEAQKRSDYHALDDCSLVLALGEKVYIVEGEEKNFKITTFYDLQMAKMFLLLQDLSLPAKHVEDIQA